MTTQTAQQLTVARKVAGTNGPAVAEAGHGNAGAAASKPDTGSSGPSGASPAASRAGSGRRGPRRPRGLRYLEGVLRPSVPAGVIAVSGRIEGDDSAVMLRGRI